MRPRGRYVETEDWERASHVVADAYFPHELRPLGSSLPRLTLRTLDLGPALIGHVGWGADVAISCSYPAAYEVNLPLTGHLATRGRNGTSLSLPHRNAAVFSADTESEISEWDATCQVLGVKFDRGWLEQQAAAVLADPVRTRLALPDQLDISKADGESWARLVHSVATQFAHPGTLLENDLVTSQLAGALAAGFLLALPSDDSDLGHGTPRPRIVKRVLDALHDDPSRAWTSAEMATLAGVGVRRLQEGFQQWVGSSPRQCLIDIRLDRARADLQGPARATVSEVAARWGFSSASRFAAAYRQRYGVAPSHDRD